MITKPAITGPQWSQVPHKPWRIRHLNCSLSMILYFVGVRFHAYHYARYTNQSTGGSAACTTVTRIARASPALRILVLEAGPHTKNDDAFVIPGQFFLHLCPIVANKAMAFHSATKPSQYLADRKVVVSAANCVGGGSSVNWMMYTRGSASDYDDWEKVYGNEGWGYNDLLPLLRKVSSTIMNEAVSSRYDRWRRFSLNLVNLHMDTMVI